MWRAGSLWHKRAGVSNIMKIIQFCKALDQWEHDLDNPDQWECSVLCRDHLQQVWTVDCRPDCPPDIPGGDRGATERSRLWSSGWTAEPHGSHQVPPCLLHSSPKHLRDPDHLVLPGNRPDYWLKSPQFMSLLKFVTTGGVLFFKYKWQTLESNRAETNETKL